MGANMILVTLALAQATVVVPASVTSVPPPPKVEAVAPVAPMCNARPWQRLVGRTVSDLLTITLPPGSRIYRLDDPPTGAVERGRLSIEINRSTRVRRVYCS
jgi:hypothetical protein